MIKTNNSMRVMRGKRGAKPRACIGRKHHMDPATVMDPSLTKTRREVIDVMRAWTTGMPAEQRFDETAETFPDITVAELVRAARIIIEQIKAEARILAELTEMCEMMEGCPLDIVMAGWRKEASINDAVVF